MDRFALAGHYLKGQIIYEMHIGTFTNEGTWRAAAQQLDELARIGITVIEMMPVADFPGSFALGIRWRRPFRSFTFYIESSGRFA